MKVKFSALIPDNAHRFLPTRRQPMARQTVFRSGLKKDKHFGVDAAPDNHL